MRFGVFLSTMLAVGIGFVAGAVTVQLVAPELLNQTKTARLPEAVTARLASAGDFRDIDSTHKASGRAQILDGGDIKILRFTDFAVSTGPDLMVWLSRSDIIVESQDVLAQDVVEIGRLKRFQGDQVYLIPDGLDPTNYKTVIIWCEQFGTLYGAADLAG